MRFYRRIVLTFVYFKEFLVVNFRGSDLKSGFIKSRYLNETIVSFIYEERYGICLYFRSEVLVRFSYIRCKVLGSRGGVDFIYCFVFRIWFIVYFKRICVE